MDDDNLVYDASLGWLDPEDVLGSLGVTVRVGVEYLYYSGADMNEFRVPRAANWELLKEIIQDAEARANDGMQQ